MMKRFLVTRRSVLFSLAGLAMTALLTLWGCGGSGSTGSGNYPDPSPTTTKAPAIIGAETLKQWINEGKLNAPFGSSDRVVVVSPATAAEWTTKGHIPGAVRWSDTELAMNRIEGLALAANMMPTGAFMDSVVQRLGIDGKTTIVISLPKNSASIFNQSLLYWDLRYWGFSRDRIKILNAGDDAWEVAYGSTALSTSATEKYTASTYSVSQNVVLKDVVRYSIGEMMGTVDSIIADPTLKNSWQIVDVRGFATSPYLTNAFRMSSAMQFFTRLDAGDGVTRNYMYPDKATLETRLATIAVKDGASDVFMSPTKKTIVMCGSSTSASPSFVLFDAVLGVAEGNIMMYDGSASQWNIYSNARLTGAFPSATTAQKNAWAFDNATNPRAQGAMPVSTDYSAFSVTPVLPPSHADMNQIESADKAFMKPATSTSGGSSGGGSTPGGC